MLALPAADAPMKYTVEHAGTPVNVNALPAGTKKLLVVGEPVKLKYSPVLVVSHAIVTLLLAAVRAWLCAAPLSATLTLVLFAKLVPVGVTVLVTATDAPLPPATVTGSGWAALTGLAVVGLALSSISLTVLCPIATPGISARLTAKNKINFLMPPSPVVAKSRIRA